MHRQPTGSAPTASKGPAPSASKNDRGVARAVLASEAGPSSSAQPLQGALLLDTPSPAARIPDSAMPSDRGAPSQDADPALTSFISEPFSCDMLHAAKFSQGPLPLGTLLPFKQLRDPNGLLHATKKQVGSFKMHIRVLVKNHVTVASDCSRDVDNNALFCLPSSPLLQMERHGISSSESKSSFPPAGTAFSLGRLSLRLDCTKSQVKEMIEV